MNNRRNGNVRRFSIADAAEARVAEYLDEAFAGAASLLGDLNPWTKRLIRNEMMAKVESADVEVFGDEERSKYLSVSLTRAVEEMVGGEGALSRNRLRGLALALPNSEGYWPSEHFESAETALKDSLASQVLFEEIGSDDYLAELDRRWGEYYLGTGEVERAMDHAQRSLKLAEEQDSPLDMGMTLRLMGLIQTELDGGSPSHDAMPRYGASKIPTTAITINMVRRR